MNSLPDMQKFIYVIGGPNGAGKTTAAYSLMPDLTQCSEYINADSIAASLSPFRPESMAIAAGRLMLERIKTLATNQLNFAFETTLASRYFGTFLKAQKEQGYQIRLLYLWLPSPEFAIKRVEQRVKNGGHHIPNDVVERRYYRSMQNLMSLYLPIADQWYLFDNSYTQLQKIACQTSSTAKPAILNKITWNKFKELENEKK